MRIGLQTWGSHGDVEPFLALSAELARRGHEVRLVVTTQADRHYDAPAGVTLERVGPDMTQADGDALMNRVIELSSPMAQGRLLLEEGFLVGEDAMRDAADDLVGWSDIVVRHHFLYMTRFAAEQADKPEVSVFLTPDLLPTRQHPPTGMPSFGPLQPLAWWLANRGISSVFGPPANRMRKAAGLPASRGVLTDVWPSAAANLVAVSPALHPRPADWPAHHHLTGFWVAPSTAAADIDPLLDAFLDAGDPALYATFGSMAGGSGARREADAQLLIDAAKLVGRRLILQQPAGASPPATDDVHFVVGAPHARVFGRCAAIIHHGGAGTTQTAIRAGVPSVIVPHLADQFFWAAATERMGLGYPAPARRKVTVKTLAAAISRALQMGNERVQDLAASLHAEDGVGEASAIIEAVAAQ